MLDVTIPKTEQRRPRKVAISVGGSPPAIEGSETATADTSSQAA